MTRPFFNPRCRSLTRGNILVFTSVIAAILLSHFPHVRPTPLLLLPTFASFAGMIDTVRCIQPRWSLYHGGVLFFIYMDLMAVSFVLFLLLYPYFLWISATH